MEAVHKKIHNAEGSGKLLTTREEMLWGSGKLVTTKEAMLEV